MDTLIHGDCINELRKLRSNSIDLICTDPPYGYSFMGKEWDKAVPSVETWRECLRILKPGAFAFVMSAPRQDVLAQMLARLAQAGFDMSFTSIYWTYSTGFPKSMNVGKAVDRRLGGKRKVIGYAMGVRAKNRTHGIGAHQVGIEQEPIRIPVTAPATPKAKALNGSYGGFQPKPAVEVIIVAMKPLAERGYVDQALANGKGVTWLDDCRIPGEGHVVHGKTGPFQPGHGKALKDYRPGMDRVPANLLVADNVLNGHSRYFSLDAWAATYPFLVVPKASKRERNRGLEGRPDKLLARSGGAQLALKRGKRSYLPQHFNRIVTVKNNHPTVKPLALMAYLVTLGSRIGDVVLDPFAGSGTTCMAAKLLKRRFVGIERERGYVAIARARIRAAGRRPAP